MVGFFCPFGFFKMKSGYVLISCLDYCWRCRLNKGLKSVLSGAELTGWEAPNWLKTHTCCCVVTIVGYMQNWTRATGPPQIEIKVGAFWFIFLHSRGLECFGSHKVLFTVLRCQIRLVIEAWFVVRGFWHLILRWVVTRPLLPLLYLCCWPSLMALHTWGINWSVVCYGKVNFMSRRFGKCLVPCMYI